MTPKNKTKPQWYRDLGKYAHADLGKATIQLSTTFVPYIGLWYLMINLLSNGQPIWMLSVAILAQSALTVRIFIFFHDCCHGSYFKSNRLNTIFGYIMGTLTFTPFRQWRSSHNAHHATSGDLDHRGRGDIKTLTIEEYKQLPQKAQFMYQFNRNPFVIFGFGSIWTFMYLHRFSTENDNYRERRSIWLTNTFIAIKIALLSLTIGFVPYLIIAFPVLYISGMIGIWMFYVQHQFEDTYWRRHDAWDPFYAGLEGSSYYKLPRILHWMTGNIGFHHIHHLHPKIPNYNLQRVFKEIMALRKIEPLTILMSLKLPWLNLWDEENQKLVTFRNL